MVHASRGRVAAQVLICLHVGLPLSGCGARAMKSVAMSAPAPQPGAALERSLFARDPSGQLSEDALQQILAAPIELELPSRVGVLPIHTAADWRGPGPDDRVPAGVQGFVDQLRRDAAFSLVTQTMVIPSGALGMEALREIAARYRLRYLLLYREVLAKTNRVGPWAVGYATLVGALFLPGKHQEVYGYIEASMFDVKTGVLMFTTRRGITATQTVNEWHTQDKLDQLAARAVSTFSPQLAGDVLADLRRFAGAAEAEDLHRRGGAAAAVSAVGRASPGAPAVAIAAPGPAGSAILAP